MPAFRSTFCVPAHLALILSATGAVVAQPGVPRPPGLVNEEMWPAATAAEWQRPVRVEWQRTWEDAVALSRASGRPILVCVNMDGEVASEHYAGVRYRDPESAKLYEPYVCVVASVYRHTPRDHDHDGNRVPCPRFGGVTCGEHIALEAIAFAKFMEGTRVAPRHIMVEVDQQETFDVYYTWDVASVLRAVEEGITKRATPTPPVVRGDRSLQERIASPDSHDRSAVEQAWREGDAGARRAIFDTAVGLGGDVPLEVLRLALFGLDQDVVAKARRSLARAEAPGAADLIACAMRGPIAAAEREAFIDALVRLAPTSDQARMLASVHSGLSRSQSVVDVERWSRALAQAQPRLEADQAALAARSDYAEAAAKADPADIEARLALAEATLLQALTPTPPTALTGRQRAARFDRLRLLDAQRIARETEKLAGAQLGTDGWRLQAVLAVTNVHLGAPAEGYAAAAAAMAAMPPEAEDRLSGEVLALFAEARQDTIAKAARRKQAWPPEHVADVNAAYTVLARHPFGTDLHVGHHYDFLRFFGAAAAGKVLADGLARFPGSPLLHDRLRARVIEERGADALEATYAERLAAAGAAPTEAWFAGYASLVTAEYARRRARPADALAAYDRGIALYERYATLQPAGAAETDHFVAMALAAKSRLRMEALDFPAALADLEAAFTRCESAAASPDGLAITAVDTARMLLARLKAASVVDLAQRLEQRLGALDPVLLEPPAYERAVDERAGEGRGGRRRRRGA